MAPTSPTGAAFRLEAELLGFGRAQTMFAELLLRGGNLTPVMDEIGTMLVAGVSQRFQDGTGPDGEPWAPSARAQSEGGQTLVDSARLSQSITHVAGPRSVEVGTNLIYAGTHQFGGRIEPKSGGALRFKGAHGWATVKSVDMPARPFLGLDSGEEDEIEAILADWLEDGR